MSGSNARECALCEAQATSQCGACRAIWFCGSKCQRTLWPTHKVLCGAPTTYFQQAPLCSAEVARLDQIKGTPMPRASGLTFLRQISVPGSDWEMVKSVLQMAPIAPPRQPDDRIVSAGRERYLMLARLNLKTHGNFATYGIPTELASTAVWFEMASYIAQAGGEYHLGPHGGSSTGLLTSADLDRDFYTALNAYFRALLVTIVVRRCALSGAGRIRSIEESEGYPLLQLNCARVEKELLAADVPALVKRALAEANRKRWSLPARTASSRPALHP